MIQNARFSCNICNLHLESLFSVSVNNSFGGLSFVCRDDLYQKAIISLSTCDDNVVVVVVVLFQQTMR